MRTIATSFVLCLLWVTAALAQQMSDRESAELIGPVKSVDVYQVDYFMKDGLIEEGKRRALRSTTYNRDGSADEQISYDEMGKSTGKYKYNYDEKGRNIGGEDRSAPPEAGSSVPKIVFILDSESRKTQHIDYDSEGNVTTRFVYKYDTKGNLSEEEWYGHMGGLGGRSVYTYDEAGHQTSRTLYEENSSFIQKTLSTYDAGGNETEWVQYNGELLRYKIISKYDDKKRLLEKETFEFNGVPGAYASHAPEPGKIIYNYDDEGRTKEVVTLNSEGEMKGKVIYVYDKRGNEIERRMYNGDGSPQDLEMQFYDDISKPGSPFRGRLKGTALTRIEYDSRGNWTKKIYLIQARKGGKPQPYSAEQRKIIYY